LGVSAVNPWNPGADVLDLLLTGMGSVPLIPGILELLMTGMGSVTFDPWNPVADVLDLLNWSLCFCHPWGIAEEPNSVNMVSSYCEYCSGTEQVLRRGQCCGSEYWPKMDKARGKRVECGAGEERSIIYANVFWTMVLNCLHKKCCLLF